MSGSHLIAVQWHGERDDEKIVWCLPCLTSVGSYKAWKITLWPRQLGADVAGRVAFWALTDHLINDHDEAMGIALRAGLTAFPGAT